jgi:hypothetical protein
MLRQAMSASCCYLAGFTSRGPVALLALVFSLVRLSRAANKIILIIGLPAGLSGACLDTAARRGLSTLVQPHRRKPLEQRLLDVTGCMPLFVGGCKPQSHRIAATPYTVLSHMGEAVASLCARARAVQQQVVLQACCFKSRTDACPYNRVMRCLLNKHGAASALRAW